MISVHEVFPSGKLQKVPLKCYFTASLLADDASSAFKIKLDRSVNEALHNKRLETESEPKLSF